MITHHTQLLNALVEKYKLKSYLEIGVQNPANNFNKINAKYKIAVDPCFKAIFENGDGTNMYYGWTSDLYFEKHSGPFDLIFIDGLHTAEQVQRDFENSLRCLNDNGFIVIHDVLPENEAGTLVPRVQKQWWGDVYKWAMNIGQYAGIDYKTFDIDNGCMLVWKKQNAAPVKNIWPLDWAGYKTAGGVLMNVTSKVEI